MNEILTEKMIERIADEVIKRIKATIDTTQAVDAIEEIIKILDEIGG